MPHAFTNAILPSLFSNKIHFNFSVSPASKYFHIQLMCSQQKDRKPQVSYVGYTVLCHADRHPCTNCKVFCFWTECCFWKWKKGRVVETSWEYSATSMCSWQGKNIKSPSLSFLKRCLYVSQHRRLGPF